MIRQRMHDLRTWSQSAPNRERTRRRRRFCVLDQLENRILLSGSPTMYTVNALTDTARVRAPWATCFTASPRPTPTRTRTAA